ncbi:patatin-like phospholipase family protein [Ulvibacterium marinum]|uniref:PNPLA domain-containing protein n=1 Tax=Ulvibacterium marinum TaxID=2419782 RepID=A0A3B0C3G1_9FLAO|nr:patatin-like phospholipase family protein [Ulvibacterium marinum]RKN79790.1 hypothetical protein D7Z94_16045 [Ulvibacterium marinum]
MNSMHQFEKSKRLLIMKGGGIKGIAYVGALEVLEEYYDFYWFAGTSAGAISAVLLGSGLSVDELKSILMNKNFNEFKDAQFFRKLYNLATKKGLYEANTFTKWLEKELSKKLETSNQVTLDMLQNRVSVYASTRGKEALIFDSKDARTKDTPAAHAVRCSMSIPLIFTPQYKDGLMVFDGGAQNNYPVEILIKNNPNSNFIGLYLGPEHFEGYKKKSILGELLSIWTESIDFVALRKYENNTVIIDTRPISTLKFKLTDIEKEFLLEAGRLASLKFLIKKGKINKNDQRLKDFENRKINLEQTRQKLNNKVSKKKNQIKTFFWASIILSTIGILFWSLMLGNSKKESEDGSFSITVFVHGKDGKDDLILKNEGSVVLDFGNTRESERVNGEGESTFKEIPIKYLGHKAHLFIEHPQPYVSANPDSSYILVKNKPLYLEVFLRGINKISGRVWDFKTENVIDSVRVSVQNVATYTDEFGWFDLEIPPGKQSKFLKVNFFKEGFIMEDIDSIAPHTGQPIEISLKRSR